jgi:diguanylate cyclase
MRRLRPGRLEGLLARDHARAVIAVAIVVAITGLSALWIGLRVGGATTVRGVDDIVTMLAALTATVCCLRAAARHTARLRRFWTWLSVACLCWALAEVIWAGYDFAGQVAVPVPSWADLGYLGAIPPAIIALLCHPATHRKGRGLLRSLFDSLIVATALAVLSWTFVVEPLWHSTDLSTLGGLVALGYPFGDVVIVFFILIAIRRMTGHDLALWCLLGGLLTMAVSDSVYSYLSTTNSYAAGDLIDVGWIAAYLMIALAAFVAKPARAVPAGPEPAAAPVLISFLAPFLPVLVALGVMSLELQPGHHLGNAGRGMAFGLVGLVLARQSLLAFEIVSVGESPEVAWWRGLFRTAFAPRRGS